MFPETCEVCCTLPLSMLLLLCVMCTTRGDVSGNLSGVLHAVMVDIAIAVCAECGSDILLETR